MCFIDIIMTHKINRRRMKPAKLPCKKADVVKKLEKGSREVTQMRLTSLFIFFSVIIKDKFC